MAGPRIRHSGDRFPIVPPRVVLGFAVAGVLCWVGLSVAAVLEYLSPGRPGERLTESGEVANLFVYAAGYTLLCLLFLPSLANTIVVGKGGIALERWGITKWHVPWAGIKGWQRERDTNGNLVGLLLVDQQGRSRRLGLGPISLGDAYYERIITASREHGPGLEDLPEVKVFRVSSGCLVVLLFVALFLLLLLGLATTGPR